MEVEYDDMVDEFIKDCKIGIKKLKSIAFTLILLFISYYVFSINSTFFERIPKKEILFDDEYVYFLIMSLIMLFYGIYQFFIKITTKISKFNNVLVFIILGWLLLISQRELLLKDKAYENKQNKIIQEFFNRQKERITQLEMKVLKLEDNN